MIPQQGETPGNFDMQPAVLRGYDQQMISSLSFVYFLNVEKESDI